MQPFEQPRQTPTQPAHEDTSEVRIKSLAMQEEPAEDQKTPDRFFHLKSLENGKESTASSSREKQTTGEALYKRVKAFQGEAHRMSRVMTRLLDSYAPDASLKALSTTLRRAQTREGYADIGRPLLFLAKTFETTTQLWNEGPSQTLTSLENAAESLQNLAEVDIRPLLLRFEDKAQEVAHAMQQQRERILQQAREPAGTADLAGKIQEIEDMEKSEEEIRADMPIVANMREHVTKFLAESKELHDVFVQEIQQRRQQEAA